MELRHLRYFVALTETRNFHRAAERLNISQPPLTVAIRKLEQELGVSLFVRGPREVSLTPAGQAAVEFARATLTQANHFRAAVQEGASGERGRLRVGFVGSATYDLMPRILSAFRDRYPSIELELEEATSISIGQRVGAGDLDVGLLRLPLQETVAIRVRTIDRDELNLAVPLSHPFAARESIDLKAARDEQFILSAPVSILRASALLGCLEAGFTPRVAQDAAQISAILSLVRSGLGVALVPRCAGSALPEGVRLLRLEQKIPIATGVALPQKGAILAGENFASIADSH